MVRSENKINTGAFSYLKTWRDHIHGDSYCVSPPPVDVGLNVKVHIWWKFDESGF